MVTTKNKSHNPNKIWILLTTINLVEISLMNRKDPIASFSSRVLILEMVLVKKWQEKSINRRSNQFLNCLQKQRRYRKKKRWRKSLWLICSLKVISGKETMRDWLNHRILKTIIKTKEKTMRKKKEHSSKKQVVIKC